MPYCGLMDPHPKQDAADKESVRLTDLFRKAAWLPVMCVIAPCGWVRRLFVRLRTPREARAMDKEHQSRVRRQLRGLTPVHDAGKPHD